MDDKVRQWAVTAGLLLLVILLGLAIGRGWGDALDRLILSEFVLRAGQGSDAMITTMQAISWTGGGWPRWIIVILLCLALWRWAGPRVALALGIASLLTNFTSSVLKILVARPRPNVVPHLDPVSSFSYPSGHATSAAVVYLTLALLVPPVWRGRAMALALVAIVLTGLSRMMLGVHWPSDIVGGTLLGTAFALAAAQWVRRTAAMPPPTV